MNILNEANLLKKMAILVVSLGVSYVIAPGAIAQSNPRPSIFNEPPYNRVAPRPEPKRGRHGHPPKPRPPSPRSTNGAPPPQTRFGGTQSNSPAGDRSRPEPRTRKRPKPLVGQQGQQAPTRPPRGMGGGTRSDAPTGGYGRNEPRPPRPTNRVRPRHAIAFMMRPIHSVTVLWRYRQVQIFLS